MKKKLYLIIACCMLILGGCTEGTAEEETTEYVPREDDIEVIGEYYDVIGNVNFAKPHIEATLRDGLKVNADITVDVPAQMGIYLMEDIPNPGTDIDVYQAWEDAYAKCIDEYYGDDVTISVLEPHDEGQANVYYSGFDYGSVYYSKYFILTEWNEKYSCYESKYNEETIDGIVKGFVEHFKEYLPNDIGTNYCCVHFDDEFWTYLEKEVGMSRGDFKNSDMDHYMIRVYAEAEPDGIIDEEVYVDLMLNENRKLISFRIERGFNVGECVETVNVLNAKEALGAFFDLNAKSPIYTGVNVKEVLLKYKICEKDGVKRLEPVWVIKYSKNLSSRLRTEIYSAATGELIEKVQ